MLGLRDGMIACLFDLVGVLTRTAQVHAAGIEELFEFRWVVGMDHSGQADALRECGASVVSDLAELLEAP